MCGRDCDSQSHFPRANIKHHQSELPGLTNLEKQTETFLPLSYHYP